MKFLFFAFTFTCNTFAYNREEYGGWARNSGTKCNTRQEILLAEAIVVKEATSKCRIKGLWVDFYTGQVLDNWGDIDIDHILPVSYYDKNCKSTNATSKDIRAFYNDKDNLVITSKKENQRKGSKKKDQYAPMIKSEERRMAYIEKYDLMYNKYCNNKKLLLQ
jgi:hypothetical protein